MPDRLDRNSPAGAANTLQNAFQQAMQQQRQLWEEVSRFMKNESMNFTKDRLEKTQKTVDQLHNSDSPHDYVASQQEWLRDLAKDYADQSMRYGEMFRTLAAHTMSSAMAAGREATRQGGEMARDATSQARQTAETVAQNAERATDSWREPDAT